MPLQLSKFTDLPLQFVILKPYHCNFTTLWNTRLLTPSGLVWQLLERIQGRAHPHVGGVDPRWPPDPLHAGVWIPNANLSIWMMVGWRGFGRLVCRDGWIRFGCANQWAESKYISFCSNSRAIEKGKQHRRTTPDQQHNYQVHRLKVHSMSTLISKHLKNVLHWLSKQPHETGKATYGAAKNMYH